MKFPIYFRIVKIFIFSLILVFEAFSQESTMTDDIVKSLNQGDNSIFYKTFSSFDKSELEISLKKFLDVSLSVIDHPNLQNSGLDNLIKFTFVNYADFLNNMDISGKKYPVDKISRCLKIMKDKILAKDKISFKARRLLKENFFFAEVTSSFFLQFNDLEESRFFDYYSTENRGANRFLYAIHHSLSDVFGSTEFSIEQKKNLFFSTLNFYIDAKETDFDQLFNRDKLYETFGNGLISSFESNSKLQRLIAQSLDISKIKIFEKLKIVKLLDIPLDLFGINLSLKVFSYYIKINSLSLRDVELMASQVNKYSLSLNQFNKIFSETIKFDSTLGRKFYSLLSSIPAEYELKGFDEVVVEIGRNSDFLSSKSELLKEIPINETLNFLDKDQRGIFNSFGLNHISYLHPNEQNLHVAENLLLGKVKLSSAILSVGTERTLMNAYLSKSEFLIAYDHDPVVNLYNYVNFSLIQDCNTRSEYFNLRKSISRAKFFDVLNKRFSLNEVEMTKVYNWWIRDVQNSPDFERLYIQNNNRKENIKKHLLSKENYILNDEAFNFIKKMLDESRYKIINASLKNSVMDSSSKLILPSRYNPKNLSEALSKFLKEKKLKLDLIDCSNAIDEKYAGTSGLSILLEEGKNDFLSKNSRVFFSKERMGRQGNLESKLEEQFIDQLNVATKSLAKTTSAEFDRSSEVDKLNSSRGGSEKLGLPYIDWDYYSFSLSDYFEKSNHSLRESWLRNLVSQPYLFEKFGASFNKQKNEFFEKLLNSSQSCPSFLSKVKGL